MFLPLTNPACNRVVVEFRWIDLNCDGPTIKLRVRDNDESDESRGYYSDESTTHGYYCSKLGFSVTSSSGKGLQIDISKGAVGLVVCSFKEDILCGLFQHCLTSQANSENGWEAIVYATECTGSNYISGHEEYKNLAVAPKYVFVRAGSDKTGGNSFTYFKDTYCPTHHKALASVNSAADQAEIMHLLNNVPGESYGVVLGGYNINPKTSARWYEDGSLVDSWGYSNWDIGEPNNSGERMVIYRSEGGWDDISSAQTDMGRNSWQTML